MAIFDASAIGQDSAFIVAERACRQIAAGLLNVQEGLYREGRLCRLQELQQTGDLRKICPLVSRRTPFTGVRRKA